MLVQALKESCGMIENVLRWFKEKMEREDSKETRLGDYDSSQIDIESLARSLISWSARLIKMGHIDHSQIILILDLVHQFEGAVAELFIEEFGKLPCWIFLKWLPQIMSYMTTSSYTYFVPIIENLVKVYPEPCFYSLSVSTDDATSGKK